MLTTFHFLVNHSLIFPPQMQSTLLGAFLRPQGSFFAVLEPTTFQFLIVNLWHYRDYSHHLGNNNKLCSEFGENVHEIHCQNLIFAPWSWFSVACFHIKTQFICLCQTLEIESFLLKYILNLNNCYDNCCYLQQLSYSN